MYTFRTNIEEMYGKASLNKALFTSTRFNPVSRYSRCKIPTGMSMNFSKGSLSITIKISSDCRVEVSASFFFFQVSSNRDLK